MAKWLILYVVVSSLIGLIMADCQKVEVKRRGNLSCKDKKKIVNAHNQLRMKVASGKQKGQPPAVYMLEMSWDEALAASAQRWADNCTFQHDTYDDRKDSRFTVGQNLAITWNIPNEPKNKDSPDFTKQIQSWYNEVSLYKGSFTFEVGHYTQVVWADTYLVGCGYTYYKEGGSKFTKLYVCNYGPAGNIGDQKPYKNGRTDCSSIKLTNSKSKFSGLCRPSKFKDLKC